MSVKLDQTGSSVFAEVAVVALSKAEEAAARECFQVYDLHETGFIPREDLAELIAEQQWCLDPARTQSIVDARVGEEEFVSLDQFLAIYKAILAKQPSAVRKQKTSKKSAVAPTRIDIQDLRELEGFQRAAFEELDVEGNGFLGMEQLKEVLRLMGIPDSDGDDYDRTLASQMQQGMLKKEGYVNFEEFLQYRNAVIARFVEQSKKDAYEEHTEPE
eukprot:CAMPEP_0206509886 /NCGR_PEP_ID=MMETSP0324_2-20121206/59239_1 /ASSEMBLY_ACC=CAM_ASM_000836 /TAXON_ID=2866 /ORGANISM="Crypthecodinium cohnii, Strain Seligo" /LENGTH=215 /DNA_ID=CAMNT_0054001115 /DNA_START=9 /DNA_END=653 /DNA_ORIENTATION=-